MLEAKAIQEQAKILVSDIQTMTEKINIMGKELLEKIDDLNHFYDTMTEYFMDKTKIA